MNASNKLLFDSNFIEKRFFFNKQKAENWIIDLTNWLFCTQEGYEDFTFFEQKEKELNTILVELLKKENFTEDKATFLATTFFENSLNLHQLLMKDLDAIFAFDPAAKSKSEILIAYPGFHAITIYRIAHQLWEGHATILSRLIAEYAHCKTGIDIHPAAIIGESFFIDHGTGIVIGETVIIGNHVKMYQGVTLGAVNVNKENAQTKRHPTIGDRVTLYANATILGGETHIGMDTVIGGNVWITSSIPSNSVVYQKSESRIISQNTFPEAINFTI